MSEAAALTPPEAPIRRLTTVAAIDVCGYARLAETDEAAAIRTVQLVAQVFGEIVARRRGRIFHRAGDGFLAEFPSASDGVLAAIELIDEMKKRDTLSPNGVSAKVRAGVHVGDVVDQPNGDLLGHGVNVAARLQAEAEPGGVLVSLHAVNLVLDKIDVGFRRRGPLALKNIDEPVVAYDAERSKTRRRPLSHWFHRLSSTRPVVIGGGLLAIVLLGFNLAVLNGVVELRSESGRDETSKNRQSAEIVESLIRDKAGFSAENYRDREYLQQVFKNFDHGVFGLIKSDNLDKAIETLRAEAQTKALTPNRRAEIFHQIAALAFRSDPPKSLAVYKEAYELNPRHPVVLNRLGELHLVVNDPEKAYAYFVALGKLASDERSADDDAERTRIGLYSKIGIGRSFLYLHRWNEAEAILLEARVLAQAIGASTEEAIILEKLGAAKFTLGDIDAAEKFQTQALVMSRAANDRYNEARALTILGKVAKRRGDADRAREYWLRASAINREIGEKKGAAINLLDLSRLALDGNDTVGAFSMIAEALPIARSGGFAAVEGELLEASASAAEKEGDAAKACSFLADSLAAFKRAPFPDPASVRRLTDAAQATCPRLASDN